MPNHARRAVLVPIRRLSSGTALAAALLIAATGAAPFSPGSPAANLGYSSPAVADVSAPAENVGERCRGPLWRRPVDAVVVDPFRPPSNPFGPGNRGIEYATASGDPVAAVAAGLVVFNGSVGGNRFVVVQHTDQLKSTYGYLETSAVTNGQAVDQGQRIAAAAVGFHLTARRGETYVDPAHLMAETCYVVRLVPLPN